MLRLMESLILVLSAPLLIWESRTDLEKDLVHLAREWDHEDSRLLWHSGDQTDES
jgi:hypothetical protein